LAARWEDAQTAHPYAWAVLTAALDAARLGARDPLSSEFLRAAAPGYCTSQQQAEAPGNWLEQALAYATGKLHGAAAALSPAGAGMGQVVGYTVADYLIQYASRKRRYAHVPASTWDALVGHIGDAADMSRLAHSADSRLLYRYAIQMAWKIVEAGGGLTVHLLPHELDEADDLEGLRARADGGDGPAASRLADLLADRGDLEGLRARADAGDGPAASRLADLLANRGDLQELRARADAGDPYAASRLAELPAGMSDLEQLRTWADAGDGDAAGRLAGLLADRGDLEQLRARADAGDWRSASRLAGLLAGRGDLEGLRARALASDLYAGRLLPGLMIQQGREDAAERLLRFGLNPDGSIACS
jgi:hypothetical protein